MPTPQLRPPLRRAARQAVVDAAGDWREAPRRPTRGTVQPSRDNAPPGVGHSVSRSLHLRVSWWRAELPRGCDIVEQLARVQSEIAVGERSPSRIRAHFRLHVNETNARAIPHTIYKNVTRLLAPTEVKLAEQNMITGWGKLWMPSSVSQMSCLEAAVIAIAMLVSHQT